MLEGAIREIIHELLELTVTPHVRELRAKTVTYGRVIGQWAMHPPTEPQRAAMHECVMELHEKVRLARQDAGAAARSTRTSLAPGRVPSVVPESLDEQTWGELLADGTGVRRRSPKTSIPPEARASTQAPPSSTSSGSHSSHAPAVSASQVPASQVPGTPTVPPMSRTRTARTEDAGAAPDPVLRSRRTRV